MLKSSCNIVHIILILIFNFFRTVFQSLTSLNRLYMSHNHLKSLEPQLFSSLIHLKTINLSYNQVNMSSGLEDSSILNNCKEIESIDLSHNNVTKIFRDWLIIFVYLKDLDLSYNQIDRLSVSMPRLNFYRSNCGVNAFENARQFLIRQKWKRVTG